MIIPHSKPTLDTDDMRNIREVMQSGQIVGGKVVRKLEKKISCFIGVQDGVATSSGTAALHLALLALGIGPGDEILLPSYVCSAPLNAVHYTGASPVICDIEPRGFNISIDEVKRKITATASPVILSILGLFSVIGHVF